MIKTTDRFFCVPLDSGIKWFGYLFTGLSLVSVIINLVFLMGYEEVSDESTGDGIMDLSRVLIGVQLAYVLMLIMSIMNVGTSYMLVMAVNKVCVVFYIILISYDGKE